MYEVLCLQIIYSARFEIKGLKKKLIKISFGITGFKKKLIKTNFLKSIMEKMHRQLKIYCPQKTLIR